MRAYIFALVCLSSVYAVTYKAGVINSNKLADIVRNVYEAGKKDVDIVLVGSDVIGSEENYDKTVKDLSQAARNAELYLVANLNERIRCHNKNEIIRSSLIFDRKGAVVFTYKKPVSTLTNCTTATPGLVTFSSDFGVAFGVLMEEDLVLKNPAELEGVRNYLVAGTWASEIPFLIASQFMPTWAYTMDANVVTTSGIYAGKGGVKTANEKLMIAQLKKDGQEATSKPPVVRPDDQNIPTEDLGQYIIRPLDVDASTKGYNYALCHNNFCCEFFVKTTLRGLNQDVNYGLAVFDGIRHFGGNQYIGAQNCAVFACAGLYKRSCSFGSVNNNTNVAFEKLTITANFTKQNSIQYPVVLTNNYLSSEKFNFVTQNAKNTKRVSISLEDNDNLLTFGIFGRDFGNDYKMSDENNIGVYDYIFNDGVQEFFDYIWIRLRILIFVVSIYVLEMM